MFKLQNPSAGRRRPPARRAHRGTRRDDHQSSKGQNHRKAHRRHAGGRAAAASARARARRRPSGDVGDRASQAALCFRNARAVRRGAASSSRGGGVLRFVGSNAHMPSSTDVLHRRSDDDAVEVAEDSSMANRKRLSSDTLLVVTAGHWRTTMRLPSMFTCDGRGASTRLLLFDGGEAAPRGSSTAARRRRGFFGASRRRRGIAPLGLARP